MRKINQISRVKVSVLWSLLFIPLLLVPAQAQWLPNQNANQYPNSGVSRFRWEGVVDGTSTVTIKGRRVNVETFSGLPVQRQKYDFTDALPRAAMNVQLVVLDGRDRVRLIESPRPNNDFAAVVRIDDRSGGRDFYSFELHWTLTDNFEWAKGLTPRFGLVEIDYSHNLARKPRPSFEYMKQFYC